MTTEALRLADKLQVDFKGMYQYLVDPAATELRRLDAENAKLWHDVLSLKGDLYDYEISEDYALGDLVDAEEEIKALRLMLPTIGGVTYMPAHVAVAGECAGCVAEKNELLCSWLPKSCGSVFTERKHIWLKVAT